MTRPIEHSSQHDNFLGVMGLLVAGGLGTVLLGSFAGVYVAVTLIAVLWTRTPAARIVTLAAAGYAGLVGLLLMFFGRQYSFAGAVSALIAAAIFWLLLRPGMNEYFGAGRTSTVGKIIPVPPRPGALPHLQQTPAAVPPPSPAGRVVSSAGSTQEQWARLQQQLRA